MDVPVRLAFLAETVQAEARHLRATDTRLFSAPMTPQRAAPMRDDLDLSERADAFVARFGRLQDTLADKLLPELLRWLAEPVGAAIDNLNRAERLGWIASVEQWLVVRRLRNRMIHEYVRDLGGCRTWGADRENRPQLADFLPDSPPHSPAMGQEDGEKAAAAADLQPATPKSDSLLDELAAALAAGHAAVGLPEQATQAMVRRIAAG